MIKSSSLLLILTLAPATIFAWGPRGHFAICEVAVDLVHDESLREFLKFRRLTMGHLCNIPDNSWKNTEYETTSVGNPGHYIDPENLNTTLEKLNPDFRAIASELKTTPYQLNFLVGGLWWRADQFYRLALESAKQIETSPREWKRKKKKRNSDLSAYETRVFEMMTYMGLMGHFVGDASMPYHNTVNFDGWGNGRGGIHGYYEDQVVNELSFNFMDKFFELGKKTALPEIKESKNFVVERMRALSISARNDMANVEKVDVLLKPSAIIEIRRENLAKDSKKKTPKELAKRPLPKEMVEKFEPLILQEMARSSVALAELWDRIYSQAGKPSLQEYKSYNFPFEPSFVWPDYIK